MKLKPGELGIIKLWSYDNEPKAYYKIVEMTKAGWFTWEGSFNYFSTAEKRLARWQKRIKKIV